MDVTLSSSVDYSPKACGPKIDVQLKCTGQESVQRPQHIAWSLETRTVQKMSRLNRATPSLLCVLVTSVDYWDWLSHDQAGLLAKSHMYWLWGKQLPAVKSSQESQVVHLPIVNRITPHSLLELMEEASAWEPTMS